MAHSGAATGGEIEEKIDLTPETDAKLEQSFQLAQAGALNDALALLAALEKKCRVGNDNPNLVRVCEASLQYCKDAGDSEALLLTLQTLATRRSQKTQAVRVLVHKCIPWCMADQYSPLPVATEQDKKAREQLVIALRDITDGKLFLEGERARLTRALATIKVRAWTQHRLATQILVVCVCLSLPSIYFVVVFRNKKVTWPLRPMYYKRYMLRRMGHFPRRKR
jgi:hypothetical protein